MNDTYPFASCPRCGSSLAQSRQSRLDRVRGRTPELSCPRCAWTVDQPVWPTRASVGGGEFRAGSVVTAEVGSLAFEDLGARDATELATIAAAELQGAPELGDIASAIDWFRQRHQPPDEVDRSGSWREADAADLPWWCWFRDGSQSFVSLGVEVCQDISAMAVAAVRVIVDAHPGAAIRRSAARSEVDSHFRRPVVSLPGGGEVEVHQRFVSLASSLLRPWGQANIDGFLRGFAWVGRPPAPDEAEPPYEFDSDAEGVSISFSDAVAHESELVVERLVSDLASAPHVESVVHEDREIVTVRTANGGAVAAWVADWWARNA